MNRKKISKDDWKDFCAENSFVSYTAVITLVILHLWEAGVTTEDEAHKELANYQYRLTGFQAMSAIQYALFYEPDGWLDQTMQDIKSGKIDPDFIKKVTSEKAI